MPENKTKNEPADTAEDKKTISDGQIKTQLTSLNIQQLNAIDLLVTGISDREVAEKVGVARPTVTSWRLYHPQFIAELGKRRQEVWGSSADKLRSLLPRTIDVADQIIGDPSNPDRPKLTLEILKQSGIFGAFRDSHETDAMQVIAGQTSGPLDIEFDQPTESGKMKTMRIIHKKLEDSGGLV